MDILKGIDLDEFGRPSQDQDEPPPRAVGSPLPMGTGSLTRAQNTPADSRHSIPDSGPGRTLTSGSRMVASAPPSERPTGLQRALSMLRMAAPFVQKMLPLLDGHVATTVSNMLSPYPAAPTPQAKQVSLAPIEAGLAELQIQHRELRDRISEQNSSLKRVEDRLEMVREATDRSTLEQQELIEDLKKVGKKVNRVALAALGLLAVSITVNVLLLLRVLGLHH